MSAIRAYSMKSVFLGADHRGFKLKEQFKPYLEKKGYLVHDLGAYTYDENDDYPDFAVAVAQAVVDAKHGVGILCCGSGQGMCIAANKIKGVRAVNVQSIADAKLSRQHLNSNILCLSGLELPQKKAFAIADTWLTTAFSEAARHNRRLKKIAKLEK